MWSRTPWALRPCQPTVSLKIIFRRLIVGRQSPYTGTPVLPLAAVGCIIFSQAIRCLASRGNHLRADLPYGVGLHVIEHELWSLVENMLRSKQLAIWKNKPWCQWSSGQKVRALEMGPSSRIGRIKWPFKQFFPPIYFLINRCLECTEVWDFQALSCFKRGINSTFQPNDILPRVPGVETASVTIKSNVLSNIFLGSHVRNTTGVVDLTVKCFLMSPWPTMQFNK